jgi:hypothetical protein
MSNIQEDQLRDEINQKLVANGYNPKLKSIRVHKYNGSSQAGVTSIEISHEFEKGYLSETEITRANLFVSRLIREVLDSIRM